MILAKSIEGERFIEFQKLYRSVTAPPPGASAPQSPKSPQSTSPPMTPAAKGTKIRDSRVNRYGQSGMTPAGNAASKTGGVVK